MTLKSSLLLVGMLLTLTSCDGAEGPRGMTGPQGPAGPQGPVGPQGQTVQYQQRTFDVTESTCVNFFFSTDCGYSWEALTPSAVDNGVVLAYFRGSDTPASTWVSVPFTALIDLDDDGLSDGAIATSFIVAPDRFTLIFTPLDSAPTLFFGGQVRAVLLQQPTAAMISAPTLEALAELVPGLEIE